MVAFVKLGWRPPPLTDSQAQRLLDDIGMANRWGATLVLTDTERKVLTRIAHGNTELEVAREFGKSRETVKNQTDSARRRLGARTTTNAVAIAIDEGIIHSASGWREAA